MRLVPAASALLLGAAIGTGCELFTGPEPGTFRGIFVHGFETSAFTPCGGTRAWWLTGNLTEIFSAQDGAPVPPNAWQTFYIRVRGERRGPGRYGHLDSYPYELTVTEVLVARTSTIGACP